MKKIQFKTLALENFKGTRNATYEFGDHRITIVNGRNGIGKSTIADGIFWVLFGTDHVGNTKFGIKTRDANGEEIRELPHSVTLTLSVGGEDYIFRRSLSEQVKRDGSITNTYAYHLNGDALTAGEYKRAVSGVCDEHIFTLCSSPHTFTELAWDKQREALIGIVGQPDEQEITGGDARYDYIVSQLKKESIDAIIKHISYKHREIQKQLDAVPVRIEELRKAQPAPADKTTLEARRDQLMTEIEEAKNAIAAIRNGGIDDVERKKIRTTLDMLYNRKRQMENSARRCAQEDAAQREQNRTAIFTRRERAKENANALKNKCESLKALIGRANDTIEGLEQDKQKGAEEWAELSKRQWEWNNEDGFCPTCGQPYPIDRIEEIRQETLNRFNARLAEDKKRLMESAGAIRDKITQAQASIEGWNAEYANATEEQERANAIIADADKKLSLAMEPLKTEEEYLAEKPTYASVCKEIEEQEKILNGQVNANPETEREYESKAMHLTEEYKEVCKRIADVLIREHIEEQITGIQEERTTYQRQLDDLDDQLDAATEYNTMSCRALEDRVNAKFNLLKWSMFRTQLDGTQKPYCECSFDGVPFADLNTAMKMNAGLEIVRVLSQYYDVSVPCVIDNVESVNDPHYPEASQTIALKVTEEDDRIRLKYYA